MNNYIDVPDDIFERDPASLPRYLRHLRELSKQFQWSLDYVSAASAPTSVPPRDFIRCDLCNKEKARDDFIYEVLAPDAQSWHGWCRECTTERRRAR